MKWAIKNLGGHRSKTIACGVCGICGAHVGRAEGSDRFVKAALLKAMIQHIADARKQGTHAN